MGMCLPCLGGAADDVVTTPDPETRRRQLAEAAEKRQKEGILEGILRFLPKRRMPYFVDSKKMPPCARTPTHRTTYRGVKNPEAVERKRKKQEEIEKQAVTTSASGGGGLKWQVG